MSSFERTANEVSTAPESRFECGICWHVYDPAEGDPLSQTPPGTPFAALPAQWTCPECDAPRHKFMVLADE
ncbi:rubredoxin [Denitratisoma sp. agr-D3]